MTEVELADLKVALSIMSGREDPEQLRWNLGEEALLRMFDYQLGCGDTFDPEDVRFKAEQIVLSAILKCQTQGEI